MSKFLNCKIKFADRGICNILIFANTSKFHIWHFFKLIIVIWTLKLNIGDIIIEEPSLLVQYCFYNCCYFSILLLLVSLLFLVLLLLLLKKIHCFYSNNVSSLHLNFYNGNNCNKNCVFFFAYNMYHIYKHFHFNCNCKRVYKT